MLTPHHMRDNHLIFFYCRRIRSAALQQSSNLHFDEDHYPSRPMTKAELASLAHVTTRTLAKWLKPLRPQLRDMGVPDQAKVLPADAEKAQRMRFAAATDSARLTQCGRQNIADICPTPWRTCLPTTASPDGVFADICQENGDQNLDFSVFCCTFAPDFDDRY